MFLIVILGCFVGTFSDTKFAQKYRVVYVLIKLIAGLLVTLGIIGAIFKGSD